jgi:PTS system nitrogen regulatory IIA component
LPKGILAKYSSFFLHFDLDGSFSGIFTPQPEKAAPAPHRSGLKGGSVKVLTIREVAEVLKLHPRTVAKMARENEIPATRIGRVWRFDESAVLEWFSARLVGASRGVNSNGATQRLWNGTTRVSGLLDEDTVQYSKERRSKKEVLEALAALAVRTHRVADYEVLLESLTERENMCPTAIEGGVAFPHPRRPLGNLDSPILSLLVSGHGVEFGAPDSAPTHVFVLVCSPDDRSHVKILAHLARLFRPRDVVAKLARCHSTAQIVRELKRLEDQLIKSTQ